MNLPEAKEILYKTIKGPISNAVVISLSLPGRSRIKSTGTGSLLRWKKADQVSSKAGVAYVADLIQLLVLILLNDCKNGTHLLSGHMYPLAIASVLIPCKLAHEKKKVISLGGSQQHSHSEEPQL